ncbi:MAG: MFS transporter [Anaerolineae bacterium]|nr:MFS transporter [Anaerolineae bacterium]
MFRPRARLSAFIVTLLLIEFLDELTFGASEAAWPLIRTDLGLTYAQIGVLMSAPRLFGNLVELPLGILADVWRRRILILGGGLVFALALVLTSLSAGFVALLLAFLLLYPASGAFVSLSQAALMDSDPARHEPNMARWTFAGSVGVVAGPLVLSLAVAVGLGWRALYAGFAALAVLLVIRASRFAFPNSATAQGHEARSGKRSASAVPHDAGKPHTFRDGVRSALQAIRRRDVLRWLVLLEASDLMLDVLYSFLALYFVDEVGISADRAGLAVAVWTTVGLIGDFLVIPLLERVPGLVYLRFSAALVLVIYPAFLLIPLLGVKLVLLGLLGLLNAGWYAILRARLYSAMPGQSGASLAVNNISGLVGGLIPLALGLIAERAGLGVTLWLLLAGPLALLIGLPRPPRSNSPDPISPSPQRGEGARGRG